MKIDKMIMRMSKSLAHRVYATSFKWIIAGKVMAIGEPSSAPKNPRNLSISFAKTRPRMAAVKQTVKRETRLP